MSAGKKGNTANREQQREQDFPGNTAFHMLKGQVLAGLQLYCSNAVAVTLLQYINKDVVRVREFIVKQQRWENGNINKTVCIFSELS